METYLDGTGYGYGMISGQEFQDTGTAKAYETLLCPMFLDGLLLLYRVVVDCRHILEDNMSPLIEYKPLHEKSARTYLPQYVKITPLLKM